jgi:hypothetical protein
MNYTQPGNQWSSHNYYTALAFLIDVESQLIVNTYGVDLATADRMVAEGYNNILLTSHVPAGNA